MKINGRNPGLNWIASFSLFSLMLFSCIFGCSNGNNPLTAPDPLNQDLASKHLPVGISDTFIDGSPAGGIGTLGLFSLIIYPQDNKAELIPLRQSTLTDVLEVVDITNFLSLAPCTDCAKLHSISTDVDGNLILSIGIKHPFDVGDQSQLITGRNRGDLHVFNVEGTIVSNNPGIIYSNLGETVAGFTLVNVDGYSKYIDTVLDDIYPTEATIHPYILHFDDYSAGNFDPSYPMGFESVTDPPPSGNLVMAMGCDYDYQDYVFSLESGVPVVFLYAVGCTYAVSSASKNDRFSPEYRIPQHNKKAPSEISVEIITNGLTAGENSSNAEIEIHVVDINHGVSVGPNLDQMLADSSVSGILIDIPGVEIDTVNVDTTSPTGTGHDPLNPLIFPAIITNSADAVEGTYTGLVKVLDSYSSGQNTSLLLNGMDGIKRVDPTENPLEGLFDIPEFATFQTFTIDVAEAVTSIFVDNSHPGPLYEGTRANPFDNIQDGIDAAALLVDFDVWVDDSGTPYDENVNMASDVSVLSVNWDDTDGTNRAYIDGPDDPLSHTVHFDNVTNATLEGFRIGFAGAWPFGFPERQGTRMIGIDGGTGNTIRDCLFTGNCDLSGVFCIVMADTNDATIEYCSMSDIEIPVDTINFGFSAIEADNCPGLKVNNNVVGNVCTETRTAHKNIFVFNISNSNNVTFTNNLIHHFILISGSDPGQLLEAFSFNTCGNLIVVNNTVDRLDVRDAFFIQQAISYRFDNCGNVSFSNNIASSIYSNGFPPPLARGVMGVSSTVVCDYTDTFDIGPGPMGTNYWGGASAGTGAITSNPQYVDHSNGNYEIGITSPAQAGDPSFLDWDDDNSGGNESRSRMGCTGGPDGEIVGLLN